MSKGISIASVIGPGSSSVHVLTITSSSTWSTLTLSITTDLKQTSMPAWETSRPGGAATTSLPAIDPLPSKHLISLPSHPSVPCVYCDSWKSSRVSKMSLNQPAGRRR